MPLPIELYEKAAAGHYTLDEVRRMEQVAELERLDPAQLLSRLAQMAAEKSAAAPAVVVPEKPAGKGKPGKQHRGPSCSGPVGAEKGAGARAVGGTALKNLLTGHRATKTGSAGRHLRSAALTAAGGLAGAGLGGLAGLYGIGENVRWNGRKATNEGAALGAASGGLAGGVLGNHLAEKLEQRRRPPGKETTAAAEPWDAARVKDVALHAAIHGGVGLGLGGAGVLAHRALSGIADRLTAGRDRRRILEVHPSIGRENTPEQVQLAYNSLRRFAPHITKDPLAGGNALGTILRSRDPLDPSSAPRLSGATVAADLGSKVLPPKSEAESAILSAMSSGVQGAMGAEHQRTMEREVKQPHAERMENLRDGLQRNRDSDIQASRRNAAHAAALREYLRSGLGYSTTTIDNILAGP